MTTKFFIIVMAGALFSLVSCKHKPSTSATAGTDTVAALQHQPVQKPGATNSDTLVINGTAAVFFNPDSLQLIRIGEKTGPSVFESTMHEYEYQQRNSRIYLKRYWPQLKIVETRDSRFLAFSKSDGSRVVVDLDQKDPAGLYLFDAGKDPVMADMMNIESQVPAYYSKKESN